MPPNFDGRFADDSRARHCMIGLVLCVLFDGLPHVIGGGMESFRDLTSAGNRALWRSG
jgi:hypothetical protein